MAQKTTTKKTTKTVATKKPVVKKIATKKATPKKVAAPVAPVVHECACGHNCKCHCHGGCKFGRIIKKIVIFVVIFALGFAAAKFCPCNKQHPRMPRVQFENGCVVMESVKCPKLATMLAASDVNTDGCISMEEYRAAKRVMNREIKRDKKPGVGHGKHPEMRRGPVAK